MDIKNGLFLFVILLSSIVFGIIFLQPTGKPIYEGLVTGSVPSFNFVYSSGYSAILAVIDTNGNAIGYGNYVIGTLVPNSGNVIDNYGNPLGSIITPSQADGMSVFDEAGGLVGKYNYASNQLIMDKVTKKNSRGETEINKTSAPEDRVIVGTFSSKGELVDISGYNFAFSMTPYTMIMNTSGSTGSATDNSTSGSTSWSTGVSTGSATDISTGSGTAVDTGIINMPTGVYDKNDIVASFNYDSLYNTDNMTPKYSFVNSSFLYKSYLTDETDYLNEVYFNKNPLEMENMCRNTNATTCGLTSSCVYVGNNTCVPGGKRGPYTTYSDVNVDYYYYKGKCYGNCPGQLGSSTVIKMPAVTSPSVTTPSVTTPSVTPSS